MKELIFNGRVTMSSSSSLVTMKVDILKYESQLEIRLIDTTNIFTLFVCTITQSDFYVLKRDQDILVDYDRFVQIIVSLFYSLSVNKLAATFNNCILRFIETGEFRNICKLELKFTKPEELQFKKYLSDLLLRMENDNVKLVKENSMFRDKCINGDREWKEKIEYLETETRECKRRMELQGRDLAIAEGNLEKKDEEISKLSERLFSMENENTQMKYEIEAFRKENSESYKELLKKKEIEWEECLKEIRTANEIIKKMRKEKDGLEEQNKIYLKRKEKECSKFEELQTKYNSITKKYKEIEDKYRQLKDENRMKNSKLEELESTNRGLLRNLENTQNVYNHFFSKKVEDQMDNYSDGFSIHPESPN